MVKATTKATLPPYDYVGAIIEYETNGLTELETVELFQYLIDTGLAWSLQGHYRRMAYALIEQGECHR